MYSPCEDFSDRLPVEHVIHRLYEEWVLIFKLMGLGH